MGQPYVGEIRVFAGNFAPSGWFFCQGQLLPISEYETLFNLIGTTYGGDGESTFALPNLQSRVPIHQGPGYVLSQAAGVESVTLSTAQMPLHSHAPLASATAPTTADPTDAAFATWSDTPYATGSPATSMASDVLAPVGGSQAHENMPPYLGINFIISLFGTFPSES